MMGQRHVLQTAGVLAALLLMATAGQAGTFKGTVSDSVSKAVIYAATVAVKGVTAQATTSMLGKFTLNYTPTSVRLQSTAAGQGDVRFLPDQRRITWTNLAPQSVRLYTVQGRVLDVYHPGAGENAYPLPRLEAGVYLAVLSAGAEQVTCRLAVAGTDPVLGLGAQPLAARTAANTVTLVITKSNYTTREVEAIMFDTTIVVKLKTVRSFPDSTTTGHNRSTTLTNTSGRTITTSKTVIKNEKITGALVLDGQNDTVRNCWISSYFAKGTACNGTGVVTVHGSAVIEDCTLDGQLGTHAGVWYQGTSVVIRRCNIYNTNDGIFSWDADNFVMEDNYLHDFTTETSNGHVDGFQTEGASHGVIRHNTIWVSQDQNACVAVWNSRRTSDDIVVDSNYLAGSGYAVYAEDYDPSEASPAGGYSVTNIRFRDNWFSQKYFRCVGSYAIWYPRGNPSDAWNRTGNIVIESGQSVDNGQPAGCF
jgi:hypothetical protein